MLINVIIAKVLLNVLFICHFDIDTSITFMILIQSDTFDMASMQPYHTPVTFLYQYNVLLSQLYYYHKRAEFLSSKCIIFAAYLGNHWAISSTYILYA